MTDFSIAKTEEEMHTTWDIQYLNWSTPYTAALFLEKFRTGDILSYSFHAAHVLRFRPAAPLRACICDDTDASANHQSDPQSALFSSVS